MTQNIQSMLNSPPSFFERISLWLKRPNNYKFQWIITKISYRVFILILKPIQRSNLLKSIFNSALFHTAPPSSLIVAECDQEVFLVSNTDQVIGKWIVENSKPFDFEKMEMVIDLLGPNHKHELLIDVGANIGSICISAIRRNFFKNAIAFEPEPNNFSLLCANIAINKLSANIASHNTALGAQINQELSFKLSPDNHGDHHVDFESSKEDPSVIKIKSTTLDSILQDTDPDKTLLWIDTQGFEGYVLSGAQNILNKNVPICLEFYPFGLAQSKSYEILKDALITAGYKSFYNLDSPTHAIPLTEDSIDNLYNQIGENGLFVDLLVL